jgi:hypothetical protein
MIPHPTADDQKKCIICRKAVALYMPVPSERITGKMYDLEYNATGISFIEGVAACGCPEPRYGAYLDCYNCCIKKVTRKKTGAECSSCGEPLGDCEALIGTTKEWLILHPNCNKCRNKNQRDYRHENSYSFNQKEKEKNSAKRAEEKSKAVFTLTAITSPGKNNVVCRRGSNFLNHSGNNKFLMHFAARKKMYLAASKDEKKKVVMNVLCEWRAMDPPGRFLERITAGGDGVKSYKTKGVMHPRVQLPVCHLDSTGTAWSWYNIGDKIAYGKIRDYLVRG